MDKTCIITINYRSWRETIQCLEGLFLHYFKDIHVIMVDNNSSDDSIPQIQKWIKQWNTSKPQKQRSFSIQYETLFFNPIDFTLPKHFSEQQNLTLVKSPKNLGFSGGNNLGIKTAKQIASFKYFWFLNNDCVVLADTLKNLHQQANSTAFNGIEKLAIATNITALQDDPKHFDSGVMYVNKLTGQIRSSPKFFIGLYVRYLSGASLFLKGDPIWWDEDYFLYYEDAQYSSNLLKSGYHLSADQYGLVKHRSGASVTHQSHLEAIKIHSMVMYFKKNLKGYLFVLGIVRFVYYIMSRKLGSLKIFIKAFLKPCPKT